MKSFKDMNEIIKAENRKKKNLRIYIAALLAVQMLMLPLSGCVSESGSQAAGTGNTATSVVATLNDEEAKVSATTQSSSATSCSRSAILHRQPISATRRRSPFNPARMSPSPNPASTASRAAPKMSPSLWTRATRTRCSSCWTG